MAQVARGTAFKVSISSVLTAIAEMRNPEANNTTDEIETTHNGSGNDRTYVPGHKSGDYAYEINYDRTTSTHEFLEDAYESQTILTFQVDQADGETEDFSGFITEFNKTYEYDSIQLANVSIRRTGARTLSTPS